MNVVPYAPVFNPLPMLDRLMQVARQNPNAVAHIQRLAQRYGPVALAHVRQFMDHAGYRAGRAVRDWIGRHVRPRRNQFMHNVRTALGHQQRVRALRDGHRSMRRWLAYKQSSRAQSFSQVRRGARGFNTRSRGGHNTRRGSMMGRRRYPMRTGGRYVNSRGVRPELKSYDIGVNLHPIANTISLLYGPWQTLPLGVQSDQRVGRKVRVKGVTLSGVVRSVNVTTISTAADTVWLWVVMDRQPNNNIPAVADVWSNSAAHTALRNLDQGPRFKIIKCIEIKTDFGQTGTFINTPFEAYIPLDTTVTWQGAANSSPYKNNLLFFAGNANQAASDLVISMVSRVRFTDY